MSDGQCVARIALRAAPPPPRPRARIPVPRMPAQGFARRRDRPRAVPVVSGPAAAEIVACRLESIARDMGETLRRTALSVNVKERLDYSCGVVDAEAAEHAVVSLYWMTMYSLDEVAVGGCNIASFLDIEVTLNFPLGCLFLVFSGEYCAID